MLEKVVDTIISVISFGLSQKGKKDRVVFDRLMSDLPPRSPAITLLKEQDMGDPFKYQIISPLNHAIEDWYHVDRKFLNKKIEKRKVAFLEKLDQFLHKFSKRSAGMGNGLISIGLRDMEDRPEMIQYKNELNKLGTECFNLYNDFFEYAHKKLPAQQ